MRAGGRGCHRNEGHPGGQETAPTVQPAVEVDVTSENPPLKFTLQGIDTGHPYLAERGILKETAEVFGVGFFPGRGSMKGRVVIPIHNEKGELIAYVGRSIDGSEPKYKLPNGFHKSEGACPVFS